MLSLLAFLRPFPFAASFIIAIFAAILPIIVNTMAAHNELGKWGEQKAADYLEGKGYHIVERDWRLNRRDLDIIAVDGATMVFVEVKTRRNNVFMEPEQSVDYRKRRSLVIIANAFVKLNHVSMPLRFDIVTVTGTTDDCCEINHIENAFLPSPF